MTVGELQAEVAYLGFETRLNDEAIRRGFIPALNRGIAELDALLPRTARVTFYHRPPADLLPVPGNHQSNLFQSLFLFPNNKSI